MRLRLFSVYDIKAEAYFPPFAARQTAEALRAFTRLLTDPQSQLSAFPKDYRLFCTGEFDEESGVVAPLREGVVLVEDGLQLVKEA